MVEEDYLQRGVCWGAQNFWLDTTLGECNCFRVCVAIKYFDDVLVRKALSKKIVFGWKIMERRRGSLAAIDNVIFNDSTLPESTSCT